MPCTVYCLCAASDLCCYPLPLSNNAASSLGERDVGQHTDSEDDLDEMQLQSARTCKQLVYSLNLLK